MLPQTFSAAMLGCFGSAVGQEAALCLFPPADGGVRPLCAAGWLGLGNAPFLHRFGLYPDLLEVQRLETFMFSLFLSEFLAGLIKKARQVIYVALSPGLRSAPFCGDGSPSKTPITRHKRFGVGPRERSSRPPS